MLISPDALIFWRVGPIAINGTLVFTWAVMLVLVAVSWAVTRKVTVEGKIGRWQLFLETIVGYARSQISEVIHEEKAVYLNFLGSLFLFISVSNLLAVVPGYMPPTGSLATTSALAICVFFAVPLFGIWERGVWGYFKRYVQPYFFMLPFHLIGEFSRTLALAVRLFGNIMSGTLIVAVLLSIVPLFVPIIMQAFGLLIGQIQAYIFAVLAAVYIASGIRAHQQQEHRADKRKRKKRESTEENAQTKGDNS